MPSRVRDLSVWFAPARSRCAAQWTLKRVQGDGLWVGFVQLIPPRHGEGDHPQDGGGARAGSAHLAASAIPDCTPPPASLVPLPVSGRNVA